MEKRKSDAVEGMSGHFVCYVLLGSTVTWNATSFSRLFVPVCVPE